MKNFDKSNNGNEPVFKALCLGQFFLLLYSVWARGGIYAPLQWPMSIVACLLLAGLFFFNKEERIRTFAAMGKDPVFYGGIGLIVILFAQWSNSHFTVEVLENGEAGFINQPPVWWPWSVDPEEAFQLVHWFFPAWVTVLLVRHVFRRFDVNNIIRWLVWNAALVALAAMVFLFFDSGKMLGIWSDTGEDFIGPFSYSNHAGTFFYLNAALACGLMHQCLIERRPPIRSMVWGGCLILFLTVSFLTASRAAVLFSTGLVIMALIVFIPKQLKLASRSRQVNLIIGCVVVVLFALTLYLGVGEGTLAREMTDTMLVDRLDKAIINRMVQLPMAWEICATYPIFGTGGWGFSSLAFLQIPAEEWQNWTDPGRANVHCDPVQFFSEWGLVGTLFVLTVLICMIRDLPKKWNDAPVSTRWIGLGLVLVVLHCFVDLPFRRPAILLQCTFLLAALSHQDKSEYLSQELYSVRNGGYFEGNYE